jgi:hypothetical protein
MSDHNTELHLFVRVVLASPLEEPLSLENKPRRGLRKTKMLNLST